MRALRSIDLLEIWDRGRGRHSVDRALVILAFAFPESTWDQLCTLPIGERNRRLLEVRAQSFGAQLDIVTACPSCGERFEFEFAFPLDSLVPVEDREVSTKLADATSVRLRLPNSHDLASVTRFTDPAQARRALVSRCLLREGVDAPTQDLSRELVEAFSAAVELHDPLAVIAFPSTCAECGQPWRVTLEPVDFVWREIAQRVRLIAHEVHELAAAYGWTEREILQLSSARRRLYLEHVRA